MTYLQIVNRVLRLLREDEVASVQTTTYSKLVGDFVNQAKSEIEGSWSWNVLRSTISVNTANGTFRYVLTGTGTKSTVLDSYNDTDNLMLRSTSMESLNKRFTFDTVSGSPCEYGINGSDSNGDIQVDVYPIPDGIYNLDFNLILKQADLSADTDIPKVPNDVVILGAWALAISERGEDGGASYAEIDVRYKNSLADAISVDASNMHSSETKWYAS